MRTITKLCLVILFAGGALFAADEDTIKRGDRVMVLHDGGFGSYYLREVNAHGAAVLTETLGGPVVAAYPVAALSRYVDDYGPYRAGESAYFQGKKVTITSVFHNGFVAYRGSLGRLDIAHAKNLRVAISGRSNEFLDSKDHHLKNYGLIRLNRKLQDLEGFAEHDRAEVKRTIRRLRAISKSGWGSDVTEAQTALEGIERVIENMLESGYLPTENFALDIVSSEKLKSPRIVGRLRKIAERRAYLYPMYIEVLAKIDGDSPETQRILLASLNTSRRPETQRAAFKILKSLPSLRPEVESDLVRIANDVGFLNWYQAARWQTFPARLLVKHGITYQDSADSIRETAEEGERTNSPRPELRWVLRKCDLTRLVNRPD